MTADPEVAAEMLSLMSKELKKARLQVEELENKEDESPKVMELKRRAEGAEQAIAVLKINLETVVSENSMLRNALEEMMDQKTGIKQDDGLTDKQRRGLKQNKGTSTENNDESVDHSTTYVKSVEAALEKYYSKYKSAKESKKALNKAYEILQDEISEKKSLVVHYESKLRDRIMENEHLHKVLSEHNMRTSNEERIILPSAMNNQCSTGLDLLKFMSEQPKVPNRPTNEDLLPIAAQSIDLQAYLVSDPLTKIYSSNTLYLPGLVTWADQDRRTVMHAIVAGPTYLFKPSQLIKNTNFNNLIGKTFHLFHHSDSFIFYCGVYKAINFQSKQPGGFDRLPDISASALAETTVCGATFEDSWVARRIYRELYEEKLLKVVYLGLQCVDFNKKLYNRLRDRYEVSRLGQPIAKRKLEQLYPGASIPVEGSNRSGNIGPKKKKTR